MMLILLLSLIIVASAKSFGSPCVPYRERYQRYFPCMEEESDRMGEEEDRMANLKGAPSRFARTGFYDKLFRQQNLIQYQGEYAYYPTYGYNANLPQNKPFGPFYYRYSNFFTRTNRRL